MNHFLIYLFLYFDILSASTILNHPDHGPSEELTCSSVVGEIEPHLCPVSDDESHRIIPGISSPKTLQEEDSSVSLSLLLSGKSGDMNLIAEHLRYSPDPLQQFKKTFSIYPIDYECVQKVISDYDLDAQVKLLEGVPETDRFELAYELGLFDILRSQLRENSTIQRNPHLKLYLKHSGIKKLGGVKDILLLSALDGNTSMFKRFFLGNKRIENMLETINQLYDFESLIGMQFTFIKKDVSFGTLLEAACMSGSSEIAQLLVEKGTKITEKAAAFALKGNHLSIFELFFNKKKDLLVSSSKRLIFYGAIMSGNIEVVKYLKNSYGLKYDKKTCNVAIQYGHLEIVKQCTDLDSIEALELAALNGHLELVKHLYPSDYAKFIVPHSEAVLRSAVDGGHLDVVKYFIDSFGKEQEITQELTGIAAKRGHFDIVKYFKDEFDVSPFLSDLRMTSNVEILKMFPSLLTSLSQLNLESIAAAGDLELIKAVFKSPKSMFSSSPHINPILLDIAAENGHLEVMKYLLDLIPNNRVKMSSKLLDGPTKNGHFYVIEELLLNRNYPIENVPIKLCIEFGRAEILIFYLSLIKNANIPLGSCNTKDLIAQNVIKSGNLEMIQVSISFGFKEELAIHSDSLVKLGYLDILKFIHENGIHLHPECMEEALKGGNLGLVKYLHGIGFKLTKSDLLRSKAKSFWDIAEFTKLSLEIDQK